jgi:hypothetical protein
MPIYAGIVPRSKHDRDQRPQQPHDQRKAVSEVSPLSPGTANDSLGGMTLLVDIQGENVGMPMKARYPSFTSGS